jgi:drug/metabolite transporter (DMT)-like permease
MSLIELFGPLLLIAAGYFFLNDRVTKREGLGALIAFAGAGVIGIGPILGTSKRDGELFGNFLIFLSLFSGAICGVLAKKLMRKDVSPALLANLSFPVGFITILPFVLIKGGLGYSLSPLTTASPTVWLGILYMALISGNLAYILNNMGQKTIELSEAATFAYLYPLFSAILAIALLQDKLTLPLILGSIITLSGVVIAEWKKKSYNP